MNKEELKELLKENLKVNSYITGSGFVVTEVWFDDEEIYHS